jgi:DNA-directed RNA polymerase beta' subunit
MNNEEEMESTEIDWTFFGLELNSAEEYRQRSSHEIKTTDDLVEPPSENFFRHIELEAPCLRVECVQDVKRVIEGMLNPGEKLLIDKPTTFKIERDGTSVKLSISDILEYLKRSDEVNIEGGEDFLSHDVTTRPENMVLNTLPVPPKALLEMIEHGDDLTAKLVDIVRLNDRLGENKKLNAPELIIDDLSELLQYHITTYLDNETSGIPPARMTNGTPMLTIAQLMKPNERTLG